MVAPLLCGDSHHAWGGEQLQAKLWDVHVIPSARSRMFVIPKERSPGLVIPKERSD
jgi:hypothetical protein